MYILDGEEKRAAIQCLADRYFSDVEARLVTEEIENEYSRLCMLKLEIEHMTGKQSLDLTVKK